MAPKPRATTGEFLAQNSDFAMPPPSLQDGEDRVKPEAMRRCSGQNKMVTCCCCCCCCLLLVS